MLMARSDLYIDKCCGSLIVWYSVSQAMSITHLANKGSFLHCCSRSFGLGPCSSPSVFCQHANQLVLAKRRLLRQQVVQLARNILEEISWKGCEGGLAAHFPRLKMAGGLRCPFRTLHLACKTCWCRRVGILRFANRSRSAVSVVRIRICPRRNPI